MDNSSKRKTGASGADMAVKELPKKIENRLQRINIKSKRKKNLMKKAIEFRRLCALEVLVVVKDPEFMKFTVYNSC